MQACTLSTQTRHHVAIWAHAGRVHDAVPETLGTCLGTHLMTDATSCSPHMQPRAYRWPTCSPMQAHNLPVLHVQPFENSARLQCERYVQMDGSRAAHPLMHATLVWTSMLVSVTGRHATALMRTPWCAPGPTHIPARHLRKTYQRSHACLPVVVCICPSSSRQDMHGMHA